MTTYVQFAPDNTASPPFQFNATLDGDNYIITTTWNVYAQGWYVNCFDTSGNIINSQPLIASPPSGDIALFPGIFSTSTVIYRESSNNFEVN